MTASPPPDATAAPFVSVVIPAYNCARFFPRALASVQAQEGVTLEIVAVNDASTDDTLAVLRRLAAGEPRLRVVDNPRNLGPAGTRNAGIAAARGEWVAGLDADDAFAPGRLARLIATAEAEGLDIIADLLVLFDLAAGQAAPEQMPASGKVDRLRLADLLRPDPETGLDLGLLKPVFRRRLARDGLWRYPGELRHGEDFALYFDLVGRGIPFGLLREAHYLFSTRIGAISGEYSPGSVTKVDYRGVAAHAADLARRTRAGAAPDPEVLTLLEERQARLLRMNRIHGWTALRKRNWGQLRFWLGQHPDNRGEMLRMMLAKLRGHRGLPD